jgi:stalled ribosome alternative rescue factor ArfA
LIARLKRLVWRARAEQAANGNGSYAQVP